VNGRATAALRGLPAALLAALMAALLMLAAASTAAAVPDGFEDTLVTKVSGGPSEIAWTPDGRMLIGTKNGQVRVYSGGALLPEPALDLAAVSCTNAERGLQGVAVHPAFAANRYVYVYYNFAKFGPCVPEGDAVNRLSRFVLADDNTIDPASELVLFESQRLTDGDHNGGNVAFGRDGLLYVTTGDGGDTPPLARDPGALVGKVLRLTDDGGIPAGNPFTGAGTARCNLGGAPPDGSPAGTRCQEVFAMGLRNPFRAAFDPNDPGVRFHVNDVGNSTWEEVNLGQAGADYGWPTREGPCPKDADLGPDCDPAPAGVTNPIYWYHHSPDGGAATGGAFVPNGVWPSEYDGAYLFAEFVAGTIMRLVPQAGGGFAAVDFTPAPSVTTLRFGPDGALYYASRGSGGEVRRIAATGGANRSPTAVVTATPMSGPLPLTVQFDGSASSDPDGNPLTHSWDFGDGSDPVSGPTASHTYAAAGTFLARLTVSDGAGGSGTATVRLDPGNTAPEPVIEAPLEGDRFAVGDALTLRGRAMDAEDGALPASALTWEVIRHHATHVHPFLEPIAGNEIPIVGPEPEDLDAARTSYLEVRLTATDSRGLAATVSRDLRPKVVPLTFATTPAGLTLSAGGVILTGPTTLPSWERFAFPAEARGQVSGNMLHLFASWSDGGADAHTIVTPAVPTTFTATFVPPPGGPPQVLPPTITTPAARSLAIRGLRASPARFFSRQRLVCARTGTPPARRCRRVPAVVGTDLRFRLSGRARVTIAVVRPAARVCAGRGPARRCRTGRARTIGRIAVNGRAGANAVHLGGRLAGRALAPGPYELRVRATSGRIQSNTLRLRVVVRPA
jgi:glucose/arabinose dehydrogenase